MAEAARDLRGEENKEGELRAELNRAKLAQEAKFHEQELELQEEKLADDRDARKRQEQADRSRGRKESAKKVASVIANTLAKAKEKTSGISGLFLLIFVALIHVFDLSIRMSASSIVPSVWVMFFAIYFVFALVVWVWLSGADLHALPFYFGISLLAWIAPVVTIFQNALVKFVPAVGIFTGLITVFFPVWIIALFFIGGDNKWIRGACTLYMIAWLVVLMISYAPNIREASAQAAAGIENIGGEYGLSPAHTILALKNKVQTGVQGIRESFGSRYAGFSDFAAAQKAMLSGDYIRGVEESSSVPQGVKINSIDATSPIFYKDAPSVEFLIDVSAVFADSDTTTDVKTKCWVDKKSSTPKSGEASPSELVLYNLDQQIIRCEFDPSALEVGSRTFTFDMDYQFPTHSYLPIYVMKQSVYDAVRRQIETPTKDVLDEYGIVDKAPRAKYTNGPMEIGMEIPNMPVRLSEDRPIPPLKITLAKRWEGKLSNLERFIIYMPEGLKINDCGKLYNFQEANFGEGDAYYEEGFNAYVLDDMSQTRLNAVFGAIQEIRTFLTFACNLDFDGSAESSIKTLVGETQLAPRSVRLTVEYDYHTEKSKTFEIKPPITTGGPAIT